jgi:fatty acyl-CoA reductase
MNEDPNLLLESLECFDDKIIDHLSKKILEKYPNAYTYSKSLAEYLILQQGNNLPIGKESYKLFFQMSFLFWLY